MCSRCFTLLFFQTNSTSIQPLDHVAITALRQSLFTHVQYVCFYVAQYPVRWTTQNALHFTPGRHVHSDTNLASLGSILVMQHYVRRLFSHISTTIYSQVLIYTAERTGASWRDRRCTNFKRVANGIRTRAPYSKRSV